MNNTLLRLAVFLVFLLTAKTAAALLLKRLRGDRAGFPAIHRLKTRLVMGASVKRSG